MLLWFLFSSWWGCGGGIKFIEDKTPEKRSVCSFRIMLLINYGETGSILSALQQRTVSVFLDIWYVCGDVYLQCSTEDVY